MKSDEVLSIVVAHFYYNTAVITLQVKEALAIGRCVRLSRQCEC